MQPRPTTDLSETAGRLQKEQLLQVSTPTQITAAARALTTRIAPRTAPTPASQRPRRPVAPILRNPRKPKQPKLDRPPLPLRIASRAPPPVTPAPCSITHRR